MGFLIARTDWEYVLNTFAFGMSVGYKFIESADGSCNGNFVGIGADCCTNSSVHVDSSDPWGISIVNGEFTSFSFGKDNGVDHTQVVVSESNKGAVRFTSSAFWGPSHRIANISGSGSVGFDGCIFNAWDAAKTNESAIHVYGGDLIVTASDFQMRGGQVLLEATARKAIVTNNLIAGPARIEDKGCALSVVNNNAPDAA